MDPPLRLSWSTIAVLLLITVIQIAKANYIFLCGDNLQERYSPSQVQQQNCTPTHCSTCCSFKEGMGFIYTFDPYTNLYLKTQHDPNTCQATHPCWCDLSTASQKCTEYRHGAASSVIHNSDVIPCPTASSCNAEMSSPSWVGCYAALANSPGNFLLLGNSVCSLKTNQLQCRSEYRCLGPYGDYLHCNDVQLCSGLCSRSYQVNWDCFYVLGNELGAYSSQCSQPPPTLNCECTEACTPLRFQGDIPIDYPWKTEEIVPCSSDNSWNSQSTTCGALWLRTVVFKTRTGQYIRAPNCADVSPHLYSTTDRTSSQCTTIPSAFLVTSTCGPPSYWCRSLGIAPRSLSEQGENRLMPYLGGTSQEYICDGPEDKSFPPMSEELCGVEFYRHVTCYINGMSLEDRLKEAKLHYPDISNRVFAYFESSLRKLCEDLSSFANRRFYPCSAGYYCVPWGTDNPNQGTAAPCDTYDDEGNLVEEVGYPPKCTTACKGLQGVLRRAVYCRAWDGYLYVEHTHCRQLSTPAPKRTKPCNGVVPCQVSTFCDTYGKEPTVLSDICTATNHFGDDCYKDDEIDLPTAYCTSTGFRRRSVKCLVYTTEPISDALVVPMANPLVPTSIRGGAASHATASSLASHQPVDHDMSPVRRLHRRRSIRELSVHDVSPPKPIMHLTRLIDNELHESEDEKHTDPPTAPNTAETTSRYLVNSTMVNTGDLCRQFMNDEENKEITRDKLMGCIHLSGCQCYNHPTHKENHGDDCEKSPEIRNLRITGLNGRPFDAQIDPQPIEVGADLTLEWDYIGNSYNDIAIGISAIPPFFKLGYLFTKHPLAVERVPANGWLDGTSSTPPPPAVPRQSSLLSDLLHNRSPPSTSTSTPPSRYESDPTGPADGHGRGGAPWLSWHRLQSKAIHKRATFIVPMTLDTSPVGHRNRYYFQIWLKRNATYSTMTHYPVTIVDSFDVACQKLNCFEQNTYSKYRSAQSRDYITQTSPPPLPLYAEIGGDGQDEDSDLGWIPQPAVESHINLFQAPPTSNTVTDHTGAGTAGDIHIVSFPEGRYPPPDIYSRYDDGTQPVATEAGVEAGKDSADLPAPRQGRTGQSQYHRTGPRVCTYDDTNKVVCNCLPMIGNSKYADARCSRSVGCDQLNFFNMNVNRHCLNGGYLAYNATLTYRRVSLEESCDSVCTCPLGFIPETRCSTCYPEYSCNTDRGKVTPGGTPQCGCSTCYRLGYGLTCDGCAAYGNIRLLHPTLDMVKMFTSDQRKQQIYSSYVVETLARFLRYPREYIHLDQSLSEGGTEIDMTFRIGGQCVRWPTDRIPQGNGVNTFDDGDGPTLWSLFSSYIAQPLQAMSHTAAEYVSNTTQSLGTWMTRSSTNSTDEENITSGSSVEPLPLPSTRKKYVDTELQLPADIVMSTLSYPDTDVSSYTHPTTSPDAPINTLHPPPQDPPPSIESGPGQPPPQQGRTIKHPITNLPYLSTVYQPWERLIGNSTFAADPIFRAFQDVVVSPLYVEDCTGPDCPPGDGSFLRSEVISCTDRPNHPTCIASKQKDRGDSNVITIVLALLGALVVVFIISIIAYQLYARTVKRKEKAKRRAQRVGSIHRLGDQNTMYARYGLDLFPISESDSDEDPGSSQEDGGQGENGMDPSGVGRLSDAHPRRPRKHKKDSKRRLSGQRARFSSQRLWQNHNGLHSLLPRRAAADATGQAYPVNSSYPHPFNRGFRRTVLRAISKPTQSSAQHHPDSIP